MASPRETAPETVSRNVHDATTRYLQTVDGLTDNQLTEPSALPGWSRAHVVAHLANHALGTVRALEAVRSSAPATIYDSDAARDRDIEEGALLPADELRSLAHASAGRLAEELARVEPSSYGVLVERTPGGVTLPVVELFWTRWREVCIHHADLDASYTHHDWPEPFVSYLLPLVAHDRHAQLLDIRGPGVVLDGHEVLGAPHDLAWWLLGRGAGEGLTENLPTLGPWTRRTPVR